jgi:hypothetical protein
LVITTLTAPALFDEVLLITGGTSIANDLSSSTVVIVLLAVIGLGVIV